MTDEPRKFQIVDCTLPLAPEAMGPADAKMVEIWKSLIKSDVDPRAYAFIYGELIARWLGGFQADEQVKEDALNVVIAYVRARLPATTAHVNNRLQEMSPPFKQ